MAFRSLTISLFIVMLFLSCFAQRLAFAILTNDESLGEKEYDPTASLSQVQFTDIYTPAQYGTNAQPNTFRIRSILDIRPFSFLPLEQLVRPTFRVVTAPESKGASTTTGYGDMQLLDLFQMPWLNTKAPAFRWGLGPYFIFPTANNDRFGQRAWQAGPAAAFSYFGIPDLNVAGLIQQATSFAYTSPRATPVTSLTFQPIVTCQIGHGWYVKSSDATWTFNLRHNTSSTIPISAGFGKVWRLSPGLAIDTSASGEWMVYRQFSDQTQQFTVNFQFTLLFPRTQL
jgi:hypothetical protein